MVFQDRYAAGRALADALKSYQETGPSILALPWGGIPVGYAIAVALKTVFDILLPRGPGAPGNPQLGIEAIDPKTVVESDTKLVDVLGGPLTKSLKYREDAIQWSIQRYRGDRPLSIVQDKAVILVTDGLIEGELVRAAIRALRLVRPTRIILAAPVGSYETVQQLKSEVDDLICLETPFSFAELNLWYNRSESMGPAEVDKLLGKAREQVSASLQ